LWVYGPRNGDLEEPKLAAYQEVTELTSQGATLGRQDQAVEVEPRFGRGRRFVRPGAAARATGAIREGAIRRNAAVREHLYRRALIAADALAAAIAIAVAVELAVGEIELLALAAMPAMVLANKLAGLYDRDDFVLNKTTLDEAPALFQISGLFSLIAWIVLSLLVSVQLEPIAVLLLWCGALVLLLIARAAARNLARHLAAVDRCLVIGSPESITTVAVKLQASRAKAEIVAAIPMTAEEPEPDLERLRKLVREDDVHRVIIAPLSFATTHTLDIIRAAKEIGLRVSVIPRLLEAAGSAVLFDQLDGLTVLGVRRFGLSRSSRFLKRSLDVIGSSLAIVATAPLMAAIALAIRLDTPGPVLFRQVRVGRDGRRFSILKFRSMQAEAEALKPGLVHLNELEGLFKIADDPRITRVGRWLRRTCLDELPQLFNVLRGEMSLVGPRPLVIDEDAKIIGFDRSRLYLTPGMTGQWQVLGSGRIPMQEMVAIDYLYVANWSLWTDVKILLRTVPLVLSRAGL
jgi:exopolysaccharide biosynthesis polyprenyl glycosylphosphotransferase